MTTTTLERTGRSLVETELFDRLTARIVADESCDREEAEAIMDQALVFLQACADRPEDALSPSYRVDVGWHAFVLHTREYKAFCDRVAGRFIHHTPTDPGENDGDIAATLEALAATGLTVDWTMWPSPTNCQQCKKCTQCYQGCHNSP